jgi:hypothetical protein
MIMNKQSDKLQEKSRTEGIRVFTLIDFIFMDRIPDLILPYQTIHDCLIPADGDMLYNTSGEPIRASLHLRGYDTTIHGPANWDLLPINKNKKTHNLRSVVFIPFLEFEHLGHFLTESVSWLAALLDPVLDHFIRTETNPTILLGKDAAHCRNDLAIFLDINVEKILCTGSLSDLTYIKTVFLPERTMVNKCYISVHHFSAVQQIMKKKFGLDITFPPSDLKNEQDKPESEKIYLSRTQLPPHKRHILGEKQIETHLSSSGWRIIYPEQLKISEQIEILHKATVIAGSTGSAFHLLMYLGLDISSKCVITLGSKSEILENFGPNNVFAQLKAQHIQVYHVAAYSEPSTISKGSGVGRRCLDLEIMYRPEYVAKTVESIASAFLMQEYNAGSKVSS